MNYAISMNSLLAAHSTTDFIAFGSIQEPRFAFEAAQEFILKLETLNNSLTAISQEFRASEFHKALEIISTERLPSAAVYFPTGHINYSRDGWEHWVYKIHNIESMLLSSNKDSSPFLICLEVIDYGFTHHDFPLNRPHGNDYVDVTGRPIIKSQWTIKSIGKSLLDENLRTDHQVIMAKSKSLLSFSAHNKGYQSISKECEKKKADYWTMPSLLSLYGPFLRKIGRDAYILEYPPSIEYHESLENKEERAPCVIFQEKWTEKEVRIRRDSPIGFMVSV